MKRFLKRTIKRILITFACLLIIVWIGTRNLSRTHGNIYVQRAEECTKPNNDFSFSTNPSIERAACHNYPVMGSHHPLTCINTATSFYNSKHTCSYCPDFVRIPDRWGFHEVSSSERKPGDLIIFYRRGRASHAAIYIGESLFGPLMNQSDGGFLPINYQRHIPYKPLMWAFWNKARYYRHN